MELVRGDAKIMADVIVRLVIAVVLPFDANLGCVSISLKSGIGGADALAGESHK